MTRAFAQTGFVAMQQSLSVMARHQPLFLAAVAASVLAAAYWGLIASDRYVAEARIVIQRTDIAGPQTVDLSSLVGSVSGASRSEQLIMREYLLSIDMLRHLDESLALREHYSDPQRDWISRMWSAQAPIEWFHKHYLSRVSVEFDEYAGVLAIRAQAFDAPVAHAVVKMLIEEGERFMNRQAHALAQEQVAFLDEEVARAKGRAVAAHQKVLQYQDEQGLVSPQSSAENAMGIIGGLESELARLHTRRNALLGYLMPSSSTVTEVDIRIAAIRKQIDDEKARLAAPTGETLNRTVDAFQRLVAEAEFTEEVYRSALVALEKVRIEATRTLKKVSVVQGATIPQYPLEPRRAYNTVVFTLAAHLLAGIAYLLGAIIRDHKD